MSRKLVHSLMGVLLMVCAGVQLNDPDPWIWMAAYVMTAILAFAYAFDIKIETKVYPLLIVIFLGSFAFYIPSLIDWATNGFESITGSMKAENPAVELVREAGGILICLFFTTRYYMKVKKQDVT